MGKLIDLTGMFFADDNIKVIKRAPNHIHPSGKRSTMWECKCSCGNIFIADGYRLRAGITKSCGCKKISKNFIDLTGMVFDRLKVIKRAPNHIKNGVSIVMWECECECGNKIITSGRNLREKETKSCGCLAREKSRESGKKRKKYNKYDLSGDFGIGYTFKGEEFWFDKEDYDKIKDYCWCKNGEGLMTAKKIGAKENILLNRLIMDFPKNMFVDFINHNQIDHRKKNLIILTPSQFQMGVKMPKHNTSGYKGVSWSRQHNKWEAYITLNRKRMHLGIYKDKQDAIKARAIAEEKYFGEYSYDNRMKGDENHE